MERREKRTRRTEAAETSKQVILDAAEAVLTRFSQIPLAFLCISFAVCSTNLYEKEEEKTMKERR